MSFASSPENLQHLALQSFTAISALKPAWGGSVVLSLGLDPQGTALSVASNVAGAVSLAIDNDPVRISEVVRNGAVDFVVNTLDEAIRAMKNEVRKQSPLSVALNMNPDSALQEIIGRGLAPSLFACFAGIGALQMRVQASNHFASLGTTLLDFGSTANLPVHPAISSASLINSLIDSKGWSLACFSFQSSGALRTFDAEVLKLLPGGDHMRRAWMQSVPRILQRQRPPCRYLWLTADERRWLSRGIEGAGRLLESDAR